jgi:hypothetical protein
MALFVRRCQATRGSVLQFFPDKATLAFVERYRYETNRGRGDAWHNRLAMKQSSNRNDVVGND